MGKYRSFVMFGMSVFIALIVTVLIVNWLQTKVKQREAPLQTQEVAVSRIDLKWGTILTKEMIETKPFLKKSVPAGCFSDPASLVGRVLISPVNANELILESKLAPTTMKTGGVAAVINPKKRAIAVKVDKVIGVAGFVHPGNRVDVLVTLHQEKAQAPITKTVLENIIVLATGPETETTGKEGKATVVEVITLEVSPEEAEKLALSATEGKILLVLRNFNDTEDVVTKGMTVPALLTSYSFFPKQEAKVVPAKTTTSQKPTPAIRNKAGIEKPAQAKPAYAVELIKGNKSSEVKFEGGESINE